MTLHLWTLTPRLYHVRVSRHLSYFSIIYTEPMSRFVAGAGFEPRDLELMRLPSYLTALPCNETQSTELNLDEPEVPRYHNLSTTSP